MKTVTQDFLDAQKHSDAAGVRHIYYKRRYWNGTDYVWEANFQELDSRRIVSFSVVTWQLDADQQNEFRVSNITLRVDNHDNFFAQENEQGFFKKDDDSPIFGYEQFWTKFRISVGYVLSNGTEEIIPIFTGLLSDVNADSGSKIASIQVVGLEALLVNTKAESITTTVTAESIGTGNGVTTSFPVLNPGVGLVTAVRVAGITKIEGVDYNVSNLDDPVTPATVQFTSAPSSGAIQADYYFWPQSLPFHQVVAALVEAAGINSSDTDIQPVSFSNSVLNTFGFDTQTDFDGGTFSGTQDGEFPGYVSIDIESQARQSANWFTSAGGWSFTVPPTSGFGIITHNTPPVGTGIASDGTYLTVTGTANGQTLIVGRSTRETLGTWSLKYTFSNANCSLGVFPFGFARTFDGFLQGLQIKITPTQIQLLNDQVTPIQNATVSHGTTERTLVIARTLTRIRVYVDSTLLIDAPNFSCTIRGGFTVVYSPSTSATLKMRTMEIPAASFTGYWESSAIDFGSTPSAWGDFRYNFISQRPMIYTKTSANNITYSAYAQVTTTVPPSDPKRYAKIKATFEMASTLIETPATYPGIGQLLFVAPLLDLVTIRAATSSVVVTMPAFDDKNVWSAIETIGQFTNYEFGFNPDETFFFRPRGKTDPVMAVTHRDFISRVSGLVTGFDKIYGVVRATYGNFTKEESNPTPSYSNPTKRVSSARYEINGDDAVRIPATADIATGMARSLYQYFSLPRRRCLLLTKFLPQLDLSDVINVNFVNNWPEKAWYLGDDQVSFGDDDFYLWGDGQQILSNFNGKIISARYDLDKFETEFTLEEVLS